MKSRQDKTGAGPIYITGEKSAFGSHTELLSEDGQQDDEQQKLHISFKEKHKRIHNSAARISFKSIIDTLRMIDNR